MRAGVQVVMAVMCVRRGCRQCDKGSSNAESHGEMHVDRPAVCDCL